VFRYRVGLLVAILATLGAIAPLGMSPASASVAATPGTSTYVALGDSYTTGPLINASFVTKTAPIGCVQSRFSYPYLVEAALRVPGFDDVSCAGATTGDFTHSQTVLSPALGGINPPEFDALGPDTTLVTVGMGGNDIGLVGLATSCINVLPVPLAAAPLGQSCSAKDTAGDVDTYQQMIEAFAPSFGADLQAIHRRAPHAKVFVVGYPSVLPMHGGCWPYAPLFTADSEYVAAKVQQLNFVEAVEANENGAIFVDTATSSIGHDACQPIGTAWLNGLVIIPSSAPLHPNAMGEANYATQVIKAVKASGYQS
jgi:hypothetical protein